jgi:serine protease Do
VADVLEDSPASYAQLEREDIIIAYNGTEIREPSQLRSLVADTSLGTTITLRLICDKKHQDFSATVGQLPAEIAKNARLGSTGSNGDHVLSGITVVSRRSKRFPLSRNDAGVLVSGGEAGRTSERTELRTGDVIREINRKAVRDVRDFERITSQLKANMAVLVLINRGNATLYLSVAPID